MNPKKELLWSLWVRFNSGFWGSISSVLGCWGGGLLRDGGGLDSGASGFG